MASSAIILGEQQAPIGRTTTFSIFTAEDAQNHGKTFWEDTAYPIYPAYKNGRI